MHFIKYNIIGILNTLTHWLTYLILNFHFGLESKYANFFSFFISSSVSYVLNSKINYKIDLEKKSYFKFISIIGVLSITVAEFFSYFKISNIIMLIFYTLISLLFGYFFTKKMVFKK